jgi:laccase
MLRVINAAANFHMFFRVQNHTLTVLETDAEYTAAIETEAVLLAPGQTTSLLIRPSGADSGIWDLGGAEFYMAASVYSPPDRDIVPYPEVPATAILRYRGRDRGQFQLALPDLPAPNDTGFQTRFDNSLRGLGFSRGFYYYDVPRDVDVSLFHTVGYSLQPCPADVADPASNCQGPNATILRASVNNVTFVAPSSFNLLRAHYDRTNADDYSADFPDSPEFVYDYTAVDPANKAAAPGTRVRVLPFNASVQVVYQVSVLDDDRLVSSSGSEDIFGFPSFLACIEAQESKLCNGTEKFGFIGRSDLPRISVPHCAHKKIPYDETMSFLIL